MRLSGGSPPRRSSGIVALWLCLFCWALLVVLPATAAEPRAEPARSDAVADIEVFVRAGCPHCAHAEDFLVELVQARPNLRVRIYPVDRDKAARERLAELSSAAGVWPPGVPTFVVHGQLMIGFDDAAHSGQRLLELLDGEAAPTDPVEGGLLGSLSVDRLGLPLFTLSLGLLDGFNPCAMWVLLFLLSLLVRLRDRRRMALIAGTFVLVSGAIYFAFMAAWLNVFLAVGITGGVRVSLAAIALLIGIVNVKDFVAWGRGPSLSIPAAAKPGLYARARQVIQAPSLPAALFAVAVLALLVNFVELLCTAGLPAIYTAILAQHSLTPAAYHGYLGLYILGYIADDALMVGLAVGALASGRLGERAGRLLKLLSGLVMLVLGAVLLLKPGWLL